MMMEALCKPKKDQVFSCLGSTGPITNEALHKPLCPYRLLRAPATTHLSLVTSPQLALSLCGELPSLGTHPLLHTPAQTLLDMT